MVIRMYNVQLINENEAENLKKLFVADKNLPFGNLCQSKFQEYFHALMITFACVRESFLKVHQNFLQKINPLTNHWMVIAILEYICFLLVHQLELYFHIQSAFNE